MPKNKLLSIRELRPEEKLLTWRRRKGLSVYAAAAQGKVTRKKWLRWEEGLGGTPYKRVRYPLKDHEACYLLRRRAGIRQKELGEIVGTSRAWVNRMEAGAEDCSILTRYWRGESTNAS